MVMVQGMSDLCAPILAVLRDEAEAFWCFAALMDRLEGNFNTDCTCGRGPPFSSACPALCPGCSSMARARCGRSTCMW